MRKKPLVVIAVVAAALLMAASKRETVGPGEIGLRISVLGPGRVLHPGDRAMVVPGLTRLLRFSAAPVRLTLTGDDAVRVKSGGATRMVEAAVRYRLTDPALLVRRFGTGAPEKKIAAEARKIIGRELAAVAADDAEGFMATVRDRVLTTARLLEALSKGLAPMGVTPLNLDLRLREDERKPA